MIHVIKNDIDPNSNINYRRKIAPMQPFFISLLENDKGVFMMCERSHTFC